MPPGPRAGPAPTMRDVAAAAGVSKALVSIVFRGAPGASEETRRRVYAAAGELGYRANRTASLLARTRTRQLAVVLDLSNTFHAQVVEAALRAADDAGYDLVLLPRTVRHDESRAITTALEFRCEALVLIGPALDDDRLRTLTGTMPVVSVGRPSELPNVDVVRSAEDHGMEQVVDHLVELGHGRLAHIDGGPGVISAARRAGFEQGVRRHRIQRHALVLSGGSTQADGARAAGELLTRRTLPSAVTAFNDHCALGVVDMLRRSGLRVPQDVSVTGYDDSPLAALPGVELTSVRQDADRLADWAVGAAIERLDGGRTERRELVLEPRLVTRGTSAPVGGSRPPRS